QHPEVRMLAPIIGVIETGDVAEPAGRTCETPDGTRLGQQRRQPFREGVSVRAEAAAPPGHFTCRFDQRILRSFLRSQHVEDHPFPDAVAREDDRARLNPGYEPIKNESAVRENVETTLWRPLEAPQRLAAQLADDSTEFSRSTRADLVVMNHSERIPDMPHVDSGDAAPTAADRIERLATCFLEPGQSRKFGIDIVHQVSV